MQKPSFIERVAEHMEATDDVLTKKFQESLKKRWRRDVKFLKKDIEKTKEIYADKLADIKEYLQEAEVSLEESYLTVNFQSIKTMDTRKNYIENVYEVKIAENLNNLKRLHELLEDLEHIKDEALKVKIAAIKIFEKRLKQIS